MIIFSLNFPHETKKRKKKKAEEKEKDNYLWLDSGEHKRIKLSTLKIISLNSPHETIF